MNSIEELVKDGKSQRQIASILGVSQSTVKHHLKKLGLRTELAISGRGVGESKVCLTCTRELSISKFYKKRNTGESVQGNCKECSNRLAIQRMVDMKIEMIEYKGGECENCEIKLSESHYCIFDFHHTNPYNKDRNYSNIRGWSWDRVKEEIDKCKLLCSNCHRLEHT